MPPLPVINGERHAALQDRFDAAGAVHAQARPGGDPDFFEREVIFDHTVRDAPFPPRNKRTPGFATQDFAQARDSNAAQSNTQDIELTYFWQTL